VAYHQVGALTPATGALPPAPVALQCFVQQASSHHRHNGHVGMEIQTTLHHVKGHHAILFRCRQLTRWKRFPNGSKVCCEPSRRRPDDDPCRQTCCPPSVWETRAPLRCLSTVSCIRPPSRSGARIPYHPPLHLMRPLRCVYAATQIPTFTWST
jgi:hypothetical protein